MAEPILVAGTDGRLTYRYRPARPGVRLTVVLLHGLTGDERVMWVLERALPVGSRIVAPRAPFPAAEGGYGWLPFGTTGWPAREDFRDGVEALGSLLDDLEHAGGLDRSRLVYLGFSQGAALAFAASVLPRTRPAGLVALAGFLPAGDAAGLAGLSIFWGHGTSDERVPIARARQDADRLRAAQARVILCESDVGHKLGAECLRGLRAWVGETFPGLSES